mgnify:CR=1 FL=1
MADENEKVQLNVQVEVSLRDELQKWADAETEGNVSLLVRKLLRQEVTRRQQSPLLPTVDSGEKTHKTAKPVKRATQAAATVAA